MTARVKISQHFYKFANVYLVHFKRWTQSKLKYIYRSKWVDRFWLVKALSCIVEDGQNDSKNQSKMPLCAHLVQQSKTATCHRMSAVAGGCHNTPFLCLLHWTLVVYHIQVLLLFFNALHKLCPGYFLSLVKPCQPTTYSLMLSDQLRLHMPKWKNNVGDRVFTVAGPRFWNQLTFEIKQQRTIEGFKSKLKTLPYKPHHVNHKFAPVWHFVSGLLEWIKDYPKIHFCRDIDHTGDVRWDPMWRSWSSPGQLCAVHLPGHPDTNWRFPSRHQYTGGPIRPESHSKGEMGTWQS